MKVVLFSLACLSLLFAGIDSAWTSASFWYRDASSSLFLTTWMVWASIASLLFLPVYLLYLVVGRIRPRSERGDRRDALGLSFLFLGTPVITHMALNSFLSMGAGLNELLAIKPLLAGAACFAVSLALAYGLGQLARLKGRRVFAILASLGFVLGMVDLSGGEDLEDPSRQAAADAPNLLLMVWDTTRAESLGLYGNERETAPQLSSLAEDLLVFEEARSTAIFTLTSHLSMLTGTYPTHHGARLTKQSYNPADTPSIARILQDNGYRTGAFVGTAVLNGNTGVGDGFEVFDDRVDPDVSKSKVWSMIHDVQSILAKLSPQFGGNGRPHWFETFDRPADDVLTAALEWIENGDPRPWFCMINMYDVHWPYLPAEDAAARFVQPYDGSLDGYLFRSNAYQRNEDYPGESLEEEDLQYVVDLYEAEIFELDEKVDLFWERAKRAGQAAGRRLGAVVTADHGEAFGEGTRFGHNDILEVQVRVPFLLMAPDGRAGERLPGKVSSVDIAPTLLSFAGVERPGWMVGMDLGNGAPSSNRIVLVEDRDHLGAEKSQHAVYRGKWKLVVHGFAADGQAELFNLETDALGVDDVSLTFPEVVEELQTALRDLRGSWGADGDEPAWSGGAGLADHLKGLGYGGD